MSYCRTKNEGSSEEIKCYFKDEECTIYHREDGPAKEYKNGYKEWYINGKLHREDGPAKEYINGHKEWWVNGKRHREDGPAIEWEDGKKEWWVNNKLHREDGPAIENYRYGNFYYLNHISYTKEKYYLEIKRLNDIKKFGGFV